MSVIAIADAHLGLKRKDMSCETNSLSNLIRWVKDLEENDRYVTIERVGKRTRKRLRKPETLFFLGDIVELWDASNKEVNICSTAISYAVFELKSKKVYLTGNHDYSNQEIIGEYPFGGSAVSILPDTYPDQEPTTPKLFTLRKGEDHYIFTHGHLFDWTFRNLGKAAMIMSYIRDGAEAFGWYSWILLLSFIGIPSLTWFLSTLNVIEVDTSLILGASLMLGLLSIPRIIVSFARPLWNYFHQPRYNRLRAWDGFVKWWEGFSRDKTHINGRINVVYGHTHLLDIIGGRKVRTLLGESPKEENILLVNIPSWITDTSKDGEKELNNVFLYLDDEGFELFGWNDELRKPYHIPLWVVVYIRNNLEFKLSDVKKLEKLGFPRMVINNLLS